MSSFAKQSARALRNQDREERRASIPSNEMYPNGLIPCGRLRPSCQPYRRPFATQLWKRQAPWSNDLLPKVRAYLSCCDRPCPFFIRSSMVSSKWQARPWPAGKGLPSQGRAGQTAENQFKFLKVVPAGMNAHYPVWASHWHRSRLTEATDGGFAIAYLRTEILRMLNLARTAKTVRLSFSAMIVTLFPASTISRNCLSSSGSHGRLAFFAPRIISRRAARTRRVGA